STILEADPCLGSRYSCEMAILGSHRARPSRCLLQLDSGAQPGALRKPDQHAQGEPVDLSVLDFRHPSLSNTELCRRLGLRQSGPVQPFVDARKQSARISSLCGFLLGEEVVEY